MGSRTQSDRSAAAVTDSYDLLSIDHDGRREGRANIPMCAIDPQVSGAGGRDGLFR